MQTVIIAVAALAVIAIALVVWRKPSIGRKTPDALRPGEPLPAFDAVDEAGNAVSTADLDGTAAVLLFVRGNWCPFCSRQVANITQHYKEIVDAGARLIIVTPKPLDTTRRVAEMYGVEFDFWLDDDLKAVRQLGLDIPGGVPGGARADYGDDAVWPTALVVDAGGTIRYAELSKTIMDRPSSQKLLEELKAATA